MVSNYRLFPKKQAPKVTLKDSCGATAWTRAAAPSRGEESDETSVKLMLVPQEADPEKELGQMDMAMKVTEVTS